MCCLADDEQDWKSYRVDARSTECDDHTHPSTRLEDATLRFRMLIDVM